MDIVLMDIFHFCFYYKLDLKTTLTNNVIFQLGKTFFQVDSTIS